MNKISRRIQFSMSSLVLLLTVACVGLGVWLTWSSKIEVLVATEDLDYKTEITETNVEFIYWPKEIVPPGAITSDDDIPLGKYTTTRLRKGQAVIRDDVIARTDFKGLAIPPGHRVVNIKTSSDVVTNILRPGDRVDVTVVTCSDFVDSHKEICKNVRVFNVGTREPRTKRFAITGLLLNKDQAKAVVQARKAGQIKLVLQADGEFGE